MGRLRMMNRTGDTALTWDVARAATGDTAACAAVAEAERIVTAHVAQGGAVFSVDTADPQRRGRRLDAFDPQAMEIVLVTPLAGG